MAELIEIVVHPSQLLLDPNNPRLFDRPLERRDFQADEVQSEEIQQKLLRAIADGRHALEDLVYSIRTQGFVNLDTLLVKPIGGEDKYLVLEGNRRTAAIKSLLADPDSDEEIKHSLQTLAVKELKLSAGEDEQEEIQKIISMRHLAGPRQWSPIARASAIYQNYAVQHRKLVGGPMSNLTDRAMERTSQILGIPKPQIKHSMGVFALYQQLADSGFPVRAEHFSLLELLIKARKMASEYFCFNLEQLRAYDDGLEKIADFLLVDDRIVSNPRAFNKLKAVFTRGTEDELDMVRAGVRKLDHVLDDIRGRERDSSFEDTLKAVRDKLEKLQLSASKDSDSEALTIMALKRLIDNKFLPLAQRQLGIDD